MFPVQVLNLVTEDVWLPAKARLEVLSQGRQVESGSCHIAFQQISQDHEKVTVSMRTMMEKVTCSSPLTEYRWEELRNC